MRAKVPEAPQAPQGLLPGEEDLLRFMQGLPPLPAPSGLPAPPGGPGWSAAARAKRKANGVQRRNWRYRRGR